MICLNASIQYTLRGFLFHPVIADFVCEPCNMYAKNAPKTGKKKEILEHFTINFVPIT